MMQMDHLGGPSTEVSGYSFTPDDLHIGGRYPGISAFMRVRNGAAFVEAAIRSHIRHFDEIVAVYNQSTDQTADILNRLAQEFPGRIQVFHYLDRTETLASAAHRNTAWNAPNSMVNMSNFALAQTRFQIAAKLDDDHLAIDAEVARVVAEIRSANFDPHYMYCFSGLNLARAGDGTLGIPQSEPLVGAGDHGFFQVRPDTYFAHDPRFERLRHGSLVRRFHGFLYWHLKYLKPGFGFGNFCDPKEPTRFSRKRHRIAASDILSLRQAMQGLRSPLATRILAPFDDKSRLILARNSAALGVYQDKDVETALDRLSPEWRKYLPDGQG